MQARLLQCILTLTSLLATLACPLRANDTLEEVRRQFQVSRQKLEADVRQVLDETAKLAMTKPREAYRDLEALEGRLEIDRNLEATRRQELRETIARRMREYRPQFKGLDPLPVEKPPQPWYLKPDVLGQPIEDEVNWKEQIKRRTRFPLPENEKTLVKALNTAVTLDIKNQPLRDILQQIEKTHGVTIDIAPAVVLPAGPFSLNVKEMTLRDALKKLLGDAKLAFTIRMDGVRVTTPKAAVEDLIVRVYPLAALMHVGQFKDKDFADNKLAYQTIAQLILIITRVAPGSWEADGGKGEILLDPLRKALIIKQSAEVHLILQRHLP
jgi:hypothetical protein